MAASDSTGGLSTVELSHTGETLFQVGQEMEELRREELGQYSVPALVHSDLRAMAESLGSQTRVKFKTKLYYRLSEVLLNGYFHPDRGKFNFVQKVLTAEKTHLRALHANACDVIKNLLKYSNNIGTSNITWNGALESLAEYLKSNEFVQTSREAFMAHD